MSAQPLVFEGPDPEQLLVEAWSKHGTSVRISEPVCVRKGGLYGFFSKLHYRIEVEPLTAREPAGTSPDAPREPDASTSPAEMLELLVDTTEDLLEIHGPARRSFDEVLDGVASSLGEEPGSFDAVLSSGMVRDELVADRPPAVAGRTFSPAPGDTAAPGGTAATAPAPAPVQRTAEQTMVRGPAADGALLATGFRAAMGSRGGASSGGVHTADRLLAIGVPQELLSRATDVGDAWDLAEAVFSLLPAARPLPSVPGALLAVVGELGRALELAGELADELGLDDTDLALASPAPPPFAFPADLAVSDTARAAALAPGWRRDRVGVVAVDAASPGSSATWVRQVLRALRPSATWAVVSAISKSEDVEHFASSIGGVDALVLDGIALTVTPAAVLRSGIPVARLDGRPASPAAWSAAVGHLLVDAGPPARAS